MAQLVQKTLPRNSKRHYTIGLAQALHPTVQWQDRHVRSRVRSTRNLPPLRPQSDSSCPFPNSPFGRFITGGFRGIGPLSQRLDSIGRKRLAKSRPQKWLKTKDFRQRGIPLLANPQAKPLKTLGMWRPEPESNRRARICSPLRNHSAIGPGNGGAFVVSFASGSTPNASSVHLSMNDSWRSFPPFIYGLLVSGTIGCC